MSDQTLKPSSPAGAVFGLRNPNEETLSVSHDLGLIHLRAGSPYAVVQLHAAPPRKNLIAQTHQVVQEGLDLLAVTHRMGLETLHATTEFLTWRGRPNALELTIHDHLDSRWSVSAHGIVQNPDGTVRTAPPARVLEHKDGFRYYRQSLVSDDLFDAFRNAYLAIEWMVAEISPINKSLKERELDWLKRVLSTLTIFPAGIEPTTWIKDIYRLGRLKVFHAKAYEKYSLPSGREYEEIQRYFDQLQEILVRLLHHRTGGLARSGWASQSRASIDDEVRLRFAFDAVRLIGESEAHEMPVAVTIHDTPRRFGNPWVSLELTAPFGVTALREIQILKASQEWSAMTLREPVAVNEVKKLRIELTYWVGNVRSPRGRFQT